jgi:hypothetical protein
MHKTLLLRRKLCTKKIRRLESSMEALEKFFRLRRRGPGPTRKKKGKSGELAPLLGLLAGDWLLYNRLRGTAAAVSGRIPLGCTLMKKL